MDIRAGCGYPASALSNFSPYTFTVDGVECNSMEGFLQSLKFKSVEMQREVCTYVGKKAKFKGKKKKWWTTQTLYWKGSEIRRDSDEYQNLLNMAYNALYENHKFRNALQATHQAVIRHSMGKSKINETILTEREFCSRLMHLRDHGLLEVSYILDFF